MRILEPKEGFWLTQAELKEGEVRFFSPIIALGAYDSEDNYIEVTDAYKQDWEQSHPIEDLPMGGE